tara:strand:+ start:178 stop:426 length:249 start_codon:yes stop_codon:yes gene_type:complete
MPKKDSLLLSLALLSVVTILLATFYLVFLPDPAEVQTEQLTVFDNAVQVFTILLEEPTSFESTTVPRNYSTMRFQRHLSVFC